MSRTSSDVCSPSDFTVYFSEVHFVCVRIENKTKSVSKCLPEEEFPEWTMTDGEQLARWKGHVKVVCERRHFPTGSLSVESHAVRIYVGILQTLRSMSLLQ